MSSSGSTSSFPESPSQRPPPRGWAAVSILLFAMGLPSLGTWLYFVVFSGQKGMAPLYAAGKVVQFSLPLLWVKFRLSVKKPTWRGVPLGLAFGLLAAAAILILYHGVLKGSEVLAVLPERLRGKVEGMLGQATPLRFLGLAAFLSLLHSFLEEYYWRWFVFGELRQRLPPAAALALSSLAFMAHHVIVLNAYLRPEHFWTWTMGFSLAVASGGAVWAWLYHRSGSLLGPWLSHMIVDIGVMAVGWDVLKN